MGYFIRTILEQKKSIYSRYYAVILYKLNGMFLILRGMKNQGQNGMQLLFVIRRCMGNQSRIFLDRKRCAFICIRYFYYFAWCQLGWRISFFMLYIVDGSRINSICIYQSTSNLQEPLHQSCRFLQSPFLVRLGEGCLYF